MVSHSLPSRQSIATHEVTNQVPPLVNVNLFATNRLLQEGVVQGEATWAREELLRFGSLVGSEEGNSSVHAGFVKHLEGMKTWLV